MKATGGSPQASVLASQRLGHGLDVDESIGAKLFGDDGDADVVRDTEARLLARLGMSRRLTKRTRCG
jgi:hypothetical protein